MSAGEIGEGVGNLPFTQSIVAQFMNTVKQVPGVILALSRIKIQIYKKKSIIYSFF